MHEAAVVVAEDAVLVVLEVLKVVEVVALLVEPTAVLVLLPPEAEQVKGSGPIAETRRLSTGYHDNNCIHGSNLPGMVYVLEVVIE